MRGQVFICRLPAKVVLAAILVLSACVRPVREADPLPTFAPGAEGVQPISDGENPLLPTPNVFEPGEANAPPTPPPVTVTPFPTYVGVPTPDPTRAPIAEEGVIIHAVTAGETLSYVAQLYGLSLAELARLNSLSEEAQLLVGQQLVIPYAVTVMAPTLKLVPDSEIVYGPSAQTFQVRPFLAFHRSVLLNYFEVVEGVELDGGEIVQLVADRFQVNPRILLAVAEHQAQLVSRPTMPPVEYVLNFDTEALTGLYWQLARAANLLNLGYYGWTEVAMPAATLELDDETMVQLAPGVNGGTVGVQMLLANVNGTNYEQFRREASQTGFLQTYERLFGSPFAYAVEPLWPENMEQPELILPWPRGEAWYFTGGPHGGYGWGSSWSALDFVATDEQLGCFDSNDWAVAMADGTITRSGFGGLVIDLDGDGYAGTGWALHYLHLAARDRLPAGTTVRAGEALGHPSCEGGFSNANHIHVSRTYNGRWVNAAGEIPFVLGGWTSLGTGREYDGLLVKGEETREACECREPLNTIVAE